MTPKMMDRLSRLEAVRSAQDGSGVVSPELVRVWLRAVAIALGGYPRPRSPDLLYLDDTFSDGFARGLGYTGYDDMEAKAEANPDDWEQRITRAHAALCKRYEADGCPDPEQRGFRLMCAALDEWAGAKSQNPAWPKDDDSDRLVRALAFYGVQTETVEARR